MMPRFTPGRSPKSSALTIKYLSAIIGPASNSQTIDDETACYKASLAAKRRASPSQSWRCSGGGDQSGDQPNQRTAKWSWQQSRAVNKASGGGDPQPSGGRAAW